MESPLITYYYCDEILTTDRYGCLEMHGRRIGYFIRNISLHADQGCFKCIKLWMEIWRKTGQFVGSAILPEDAKIYANHIINNPDKVPYSSCTMGFFYLGVTGGEKESEHYFNIAWKNNNLIALKGLADIYIFKTPDIRKAIDFNTIGSRLGNSHCTEELAEIYFEGYNTHDYDNPYGESLFFDKSRGLRYFKLSNNPYGESLFFDKSRGLRYFKLSIAQKEPCVCTCSLGIVPLLRTFLNNKKFQSFARYEKIANEFREYNSELPTGIVGGQWGLLPRIYNLHQALEYYSNPNFTVIRTTVLQSLISQSHILVND